MQNFIRGCLTALAVGVIVIVFFAVGFLGNAYRSGAVTPAYATRAEGLDSIAAPPANFDVFFETLGLLNQDFYGDLPEGEEVPYAAIRGVLSQLNDPNTIFVEPVAHEREQEQFQGEFGGIGAQVELNEEGQVVIVAPIADTPADRADLRPNDIILEANETVLTGMTINEAVEFIRGPVGTEVTLLIQRPDEEESFSLTLVREKIPDPTVHSTMVEGTNIGYIRMSFFSARTTEELRTALTDLKAEGAEKFILDLRNNPGGLLDSAIGTASLFIGDGVIAYQQRNDGTRQALEARGDPIAPDEPLLVLINEGSASASEILAGALQAEGRATLVGSKSYGKGTVQIPFTLSDGSSLHVTIAHWLTPDGIDLSSEGLTPEEAIEITEEQQAAGQDPVFERAIELLKETN
ncbi:MAG: S41 family peptidase [Ardenticatenales bacterium]|nr:S41 family peptidase [Ardenticatenales bacterium]